MWQDEGYGVFGRRRILKGPDLPLLLESHEAFLRGKSYPLEFHPDRYPNWCNHIAPLELCVASMEPCGEGSVNLSLQEAPDKSFTVYRVYDYSLSVFKGNLEELRWRGEDSAILYKPVRNPDVREMMKLSDGEFIFAYGVLMWSYSDQLPCQCHHPDCEVIIRGALDLRKYGGRYLCPGDFVKEVTADLEDKGHRPKPSKYIQRVAKLLPDRLLSVSVWPKGILRDESLGASSYI